MFLVGIIFRNFAPASFNNFPSLKNFLIEKNGETNYLYLSSPLSLEIVTIAIDDRGFMGYVMKKINGLAAGGYNNNYDDFHIRVGFSRRIWISFLDHAFPFADANYQLCQSSLSLLEH